MINGQGNYRLPRKRPIFRNPLFDNQLRNKTGWDGCLQQLGNLVQAADFVIRMGVSDVVNAAIAANPGGCDTKIPGTFNVAVQRIADVQHIARAYTHEVARLLKNGRVRLVTPGLLTGQNSIEFEVVLFDGGQEMIRVGIGHTADGQIERYDGRLSFLVQTRIAPIGIESIGVRMGIDLADDRLEGLDKALALTIVKRLEPVVIARLNHPKKTISPRNGQFPG